MPAMSRLYRRVFPFWIALAALAAMIRIARPSVGGSAAGGRLLTGIEPITVLRAILQRPRQQLGQVILCFGLPTLARKAGEQDSLFRDDVNLGESFWSLAVGVRYHTPQETLRAGLPVLGLRKEAIPLVRLPGEGPPPRPQQETPAREPVPVPEQAQVPEGRIVIYHTHTSESYLPISGRDHLHNGAGDIVRVGDYLAGALEGEGFAVTHDATINDQFPFRDAYRRSLETAKRLLGDVPDPVALIDLHRDATPGVVGTIELGGDKVARLALVIGTNRMGLAHPHWRENLAFANALRDAAERLYPGLLARIDIADARYNQHLNPRAIIVEVGNQYSTAVEVYRAAACLAKILAEVRRTLPADGAAAANTPPAAEARPPG